MKMQNIINCNSTREQQKQKIYQKQYHEHIFEVTVKQIEFFSRYIGRNDSKFHSGLAMKETCRLCGRVVTYQNMPKHVKTLLCKRRVICG